MPSGMVAFLVQYAFPRSMEEVAQANDEYKLAGDAERETAVPDQWAHTLFLPVLTSADLSGLSDEAVLFACLAQLRC